MHELLDGRPRRLLGDIGAGRHPRVKTPINGSRRIVVLSRKGGVGKTTTTLMLGHTFASWRGDRVVALDGNPEARLLPKPQCLGVRK